MRRAILLFCLLLFISGCTKLNSSSPFRYVPSPNSFPPIKATVGIEKFADARPEEDRVATKNILDLDKKVTSKIIEDFRSSRLFSVMDFPPLRANDDFVLTGEIKRFYWKIEHNPLKYIPIVNLVMLAGISSYRVAAIAEIKIQLLDSKTASIVTEYDKTATRKDSVSIYNSGSEEPGAELAEAFRQVMKEIKGEMASDFHKGRITVPIE